MKTKGKIYISGNVAGVAEDELMAKFQRTHKMLSARGFEVVNPLFTVNRWNGDRWQDSLQHNLNILSECTSIYMMPCTENSEVAQIELNKAMLLNLDIYYELENVEANEPVEELYSKK